MSLRVDPPKSNKLDTEGSSTTENFALVTGGAGGFGSAVAKAILLQKKGYQVALADINLERVRSVAKSIGAGAHYFQVDVGNEDSVKKLFSGLAGITDRIDVLVSAHGLTAGKTGIQDVPLEEWNSALNTNLTGAFLCMKHVMPLMLKQSSGCIINLTTGNPARKLTCTYIASKIGVEGLTTAVAEDVKDSHIGVYAVAPGGYTSTLFHDNSYQLMHFKNYVSSAELQRQSRGLKPEVIVPLCLHLIEDRTLGMTGKKIVALEWNKQNGLGADVWYA
ncbi:MAG: SDR family oxidoreductase [Nitrososphaerales archaeon]